jgi:hypothetical protein
MGRFLFLFLSLLIFFAIRPFLEGLIQVGFLADLFMTLILASGVCAVGRRGHMLFALLLVGLALGVRWVNYVVPLPYAEVIVNILAIIFFTFLIVVILNHINREKEISFDIIMGVICVYLVIGIIWADIYSLLETFQPGSFNLPEGIEVKAAHFVYFSYVTLTTLGYGDITPISNPARNLAVLEAMMGQLYLAVLIAGLVGKYIAEKR